MKQAILTLLSALIDALKQDSVKYHSLVLPLIRSSVEPGSVSIPFSYRNTQCADEIYKGVIALPLRGGLRALGIDNDANYGPCISGGSFSSSCTVPDVRRRNR